MNIEVEIRSFISEEKYLALLEFFKQESELINEDEQETHYFDCKEDLRIQQNQHYSKVWLKKGKLHDSAREEIEIKLPKEDFSKLQLLFFSLGYSIGIKWFRKRHTFSWKGISVMLDNTKGYGYIIELEKMSNEEDKEITLKELKTKLASLEIHLTPKEEFSQKYEFYRENWQDLVGTPNK